MKERKKPTQSWVEKSKYEIDNSNKLLAERAEELKEIRMIKEHEIKKLLYQDSEAFKVGYEAGFAKACEMLHDFALIVRKMRKAQSNFYRDKRRDKYAYQNMRNKEANVDFWIRENYPHLMEEENVNG